MIVVCQWLFATGGQCEKVTRFGMRFCSDHVQEYTNSSPVDRERQDLTAPDIQLS